MASYTVNAYNNNGSGGSVNMRSGAGTNYDLVVRVPHGATVTGTKSGVWSQMSYGSYSGYMMSVYLDAQSSGGTWVTRWTNTPGETVNVRSGPSTSNGVVRTLSHGTKVEVNAPSSTWSQVRLFNTTAVIGYMMTSFLVTSDPSGGTTPSSTIYAGTINAVDTAVRSSMSTSSSANNLLGRYEKGAPVGYRITADSNWHQVYFGYKPTSIGYTKANLITSSTLEMAALLGAIAQFWYDKQYTQSKFGMGGSQDQWCQWFVNFCVTQAGLSPSNAWTTNTNCTGGWNAMKSKKSTVPSVGSIFYTQKGNDTVSHTGIVVKYVSSTQCYVVEGNYNGSSNLNRRLFDTQNMPAGITFLGFVKPTGM